MEEVSNNVIKFCNLNFINTLYKTSKKYFVTSLIPIVLKLQKGLYMKNLTCYFSYYFMSKKIATILLSKQHTKIGT